MKTLYELGAEYAALEATIAEQAGEIDPELDRLFAEFEADDANKLESYYRLIRRLEMEASAAKAEAEQYAAMARYRESTVGRLKERLKGYLEFTGRTKAVTSSGKTFAVQRNGGKPPILFADGFLVSNLPDDLVRVMRAPDNDAILAALANGETLPGVTLGERGTHLRIK